jgi:Tfp pilus assembly protein PilV
MKKNLITYTKGFTIVETLVAIAILMISIAGPLTIAQKGLLASVYARDQSVATFLAQDAMEFAKNHRDAIYDSNNPEDWLGDLAGCTEASPCPISTIGNGAIDIGSPTLYRTNSGFDTTGEVASSFSRVLYVEDVQTNIEARVVVVVNWTSGTIKNVVTLENYFFNVKL